MVQQITSAELSIFLKQGFTVWLIDVRQPWESKIAFLANSIFIPLNELPQRSSEVANLKGDAIVVYCHHGIRSLSAANYLEKLGLEKVKSLKGGIDAWSCEVDPSVPRY